MSQPLRPVPCVDTMKKIRLVAAVDFGHGSNAELPCVVQLLATDRDHQKRSVHLDECDISVSDFKTRVGQAFAELGGGMTVAATADECLYLLAECSLPCSVLDEHELRGAVNNERRRKRIYNIECLSEYKTPTVPLFDGDFELKPAFYRSWRLMNMLNEYVRLKNVDCFPRDRNVAENNADA